LIDQQPRTALQLMIMLLVPSGAIYYLFQAIGSVKL